MSDNEKALIAAAGAGNVEEIRRLKNLGTNLDAADANDWTALQTGAFNGKKESVKVLVELGASVNKADSDGITPLFLAAQEGHNDTITLLHSLGGSVTQANNNGDTPLTIAISNQHPSTVTLLRGLGATLPTEQLDLATVADVVNFFETLGINPGGNSLTTIKENIEKEKVDAAKLFAVFDGDAMHKLLDPTMHKDWGKVFYNIVQNHKALQDDRAQSSGAAALAAEALKHMDNPAVRHELFELQRKLFVEYSEKAFPSLVRGVASAPRSSSSSSSSSSSLLSSPPLSAAEVDVALHDLLERIADLAKQEEARLGAEVTATCLAKYKSLKERWAFLGKLLTPEEVWNVQPIANTSFGLERNGECEASPLGSTGGDNPHLERLEHLVALSKALNAFFQRQMEKVTDAVNEALNPQSLGLAADDFGLPFNDDLRANNGKRVALSFGPIKRADRALKKAHEYGEFLFIIM